MNNSDLLRLLDFSNCKTEEDVYSHAKIVAEALMFNFKIKSSTGVRSLEGIEFYVVIPGVFEDDKNKGGATHMRDEQLDSGTFYSHTKSKGNKPWKAPGLNYTGIDITCGNRNKNIYGGILLRHLGASYSNNPHRDGSGYAARSILRGDSGFETIPRNDIRSKLTDSEKIFLEKLNRSAIFNNLTCLVPNLEQKSKKLKIGTRIGIDDKKYALAPLRFYFE